MADTPNYHINLWPDPPGSPSTYLCLVPDCGYGDATEAEILVHETVAHGLTPVPTAIAAAPPLLPTFSHARITTAASTYTVTHAADETPVYYCLSCAKEGVDHHTDDLDVLRDHMEQLHDGRMQDAAEAKVEDPGPPEQA
jgi:hypothetical protein